MSSDDLLAALRRNGVTDVDSTRLTRLLYSSDASLYRVVPQVVVRPRDSDEVLATLDACLQTQTPATSRGAGTSIAGNAVGTGVILDFVRHLNRVIAVDPEAGHAIVEPGVAHATLQKAAAPYGLRFGPDPSTHTRCTIGGMIGNNACGTRALGYGRTADNLVALDAATMAGERLTFAADTAAAPVSDRLEELATANLQTLRTQFGTFGRQVSGYALEQLLPERRRNLAAFMAGSEGTLAVTLQATVSLVRDAPHRVLVALGYPSIAEAADAVPALLPFRPIACEGVDDRMLELARRSTIHAQAPTLPSAGGWLFVELAGDDLGELEARAQQVLAAGDTRTHRVLTSPAEQRALWSIREDGAALSSQSLPRPGLPGWEDAAVPPERLGDYLREFARLLTEHDLHCIPYGHFGDGCVHVRLDFPLGSPSGPAALHQFLVDAAQLVARFGGSLSGEHGDGRARSELLPLMYSPDAMALFGQVKQIFDPGNLLNPGVLVEPRSVVDDLRPRVGVLARPAGGLRLVEDRGDFNAAAGRCVGVGKCVSPAPTAAHSVMCPSYLATHAEKDSTRGRARVLQDMITGADLDAGWKADEVHEVLDLCLSCKGCLNECPTGVDMAMLKAEATHARYRRRPRPRSHLALGWLPVWLRLASPFARIANGLVRIPLLHRMATWSAGVDSRRGLPRFAPQPFLRWATGRKRASAPSGRRRVLLWSDTFTNYLSTGPGRAAYGLLERAGYAVETLDQPACCGLTWISTGQLGQARKVLGRTLDILHPYAAQGIPIVGLEPSCLAVFRSDANQLVDDPKVAEVAAAIFTLAELLSQSPDWSPPDLTGIEVIAQPHCHQASVLGWDADEAILVRAGASVRRLGGCCGMAGNFGMEAGHYDVSVAVAEQQLLPAVDERSAHAVVLADGFSCRTQLDDLRQVTALHLAELLLGGAAEAERATRQHA
jgi:FAD/FMN-containing dehydrogenase/Fe-S oxidoreductase